MYICRWCYHDCFVCFRFVCDGLFAHPTSFACPFLLRLSYGIWNHEFAVYIFTFEPVLVLESVRPLSLSNALPNESNKALVMHIYAVCLYLWRRCVWIDPQACKQAYCENSKTVACVSSYNMCCHNTRQRLQWDKVVYVCCEECCWLTLTNGCFVRVCCILPNAFWPNPNL